MLSVHSAGSFSAARMHVMLTSVQTKQFLAAGVCTIHAWGVAASCQITLTTCYDQAALRPCSA